MNLNTLTILLAIFHCSFNISQLYAASGLKHSVYESDKERIMYNGALFNPEVSLKAGDTLDYRFARVADAQYQNTVSLESVLEDIKCKIITSVYPVRNLTLSLAENYITETGFKQLVDFFLHPENDEVSQEVTHINLSNNRIKIAAQDDIYRLLNARTDITLDLSINYLSLSELVRLTPEMKKRITDRSY